MPVKSIICTQGRLCLYYPLPVHRGDYACIVLLDLRYSRPSTVAALPDWITRSLIVTQAFPAAHAAIAKVSVARLQPGSEWGEHCS